MGIFTMCLLVAEDTTKKSATAVVPLVTWHSIATTGRVELLAELANWVFFDIVRPVSATGCSVAAATSATFPPAIGVITILLVFTS